MRLACIALLGGLLCLPVLPVIPSWPWLLLAGLAGLGLLRTLLYPLGWMLLGFTWACLSAGQALEQRLAPELDGRTLWLEGRVAGLPQQREGIWRFELQDVQARRAQLPARLRVAWHAGPAVQAGEYWRLAVKLKRPRGQLNPQGFDYEAWLLAQRLGATGTVKHGYRLQAAQGASQWRDQLRQHLLSLEQGPALAALLVGDGAALSAMQWQVLQATGTQHLMVISGQHISLLAGLLYGLVAGLQRLGCWPARWPWLPAACLLALSGALAYGWLAGFAVPVQRACLMLALVLLWRWRFRHLRIWTPWLLALCLVLLFEPLASLRPGFWLSFAAVAILLLCFSARLGARSWLASLGWAQWAIALGLLPLLLVLGLPVSLSGPLANLLAVPWVSLLVLPLALLGCLLLPLGGLGEGLLWLAGWGLQLLFTGLQWLAEQQGAHAFAALPWPVLLATGLAALLWLLPAGVPLRWPGLLLWLPLLSWTPARPPVAEARVWLLDVGQGLSVLVQTHQHDLLYDSGPRSVSFDSGAQQVLPSLRALGVRKLDRFIISHADNDHAGGAAAVLQGVPVRQLVSGEPRRLRLTRQAEPCTWQTWQWDGVHFSQWQWAQASDGNQASCVLRIEAAGEVLLLSGDIDARAEQAWLAGPQAGVVDWLLAPHHGSRTSSSALFLAHARPRHVLFTRGWNNAFGHPHEEVVQRYLMQGVQAWDTARQGALLIALGRREPARGLREQQRFWREK